VATARAGFEVDAVSANDYELVTARDRGGATHGVESVSLVAVKVS
jgi:hypothetical protein